MKSALAANMIRSEWPWPSPVPIVPPEPNDMSDCPICSQALFVVKQLNGSCQAVTRAFT